MLADTLMELMKLAAVSGLPTLLRGVHSAGRVATIAPDSSRLQRDADLSQLHSHG